MPLPNLNSGHAPDSDELHWLLPHMRSKPADTPLTPSSVTMQADPDLIFAVESGVSYAVEGFIVWVSGTTPDIKFDLGGTSAPGFKLAFLTCSRAATAGAALVDSRTIISGGSAAIPGQGTTVNSQAQYTAITGTCTAAADGSIMLRAAQATADASTTTVLAGSWLRLTPQYQY